MVTDAEQVVTPEGAQATPPPAPAAEPVPAPIFEPTEEQLEGFLKSKSHDDLKKYQAYNQVAKQVSERERRTIQAQLAEERQRNAQMQQAAAYFDNLKQTMPMQLIQALDDPRQLEVYQAVQRWRQNGGGSGANEADIYARWEREIVQELQDDEELSSVDITELDRSKASSFIKGLAKAATAKERQQMQKDMEALQKRMMAEMEAKLNERLAQLQSGTPEPEKVQAGVMSQGAVPTPAQYASMTPEQRRKAGESGELDKWSQAWQQPR